ncbi:transcriptional regulator, IclR family protein [Rhodobacterales bacterium HTCC2150]|nr:transcriptional regulator, IclR family protein [Rhodobacterales bacterium HTCC2150] [Rhodobacteraceae bacterium HTCC2150]
MSSAAKTLELLSHFSTDRPQIGLTDFCRLAARDKATTYRHLQALESAGFIEQDAETKRYQLGPVVLQLAQVRESTVPRKQSAETALAALAKATGETAHASVLSGTTMYTLASCESLEHSTRAILDVQTLPLHATASGICAVAFGPDDLKVAATQNMEKFTSTTASSAQELSVAVDQARTDGFAYSNSSFEDEIYSISAPVFDLSGGYAGSVSVACVATRVTEVLKATIRQQLATASVEITRNWGGTVPIDLQKTWDRTLSLHTPLTQNMKAAS